MGTSRFTGDEIEYLSSQCVEKSDDAQMQEISAALDRIRDEVYRYKFGSGTYTSATLMQQPVTAQAQGAPKITLTIRTDTYLFTPQRDITAYELAKITELFVTARQPSLVNLDSWWDEAGPSIWRHFCAI